MLLERALKSLLAQTHTEWRCIVFDDCPDGSARRVVESLNDARLTYEHNPRSKGAIGNIDQCFRNSPYLGGAYACVLEDDNYLLEDYLRRNIELCQVHKVDVLFCDQKCEEIITPGEVGVVGVHNTIGSIYKAGVHDLAELLPAILFSPGFSNGSAFWRLGGASNFEMGPITKNPGIQETARLLRVRGRVYVSHEALAVWRRNDPRESFVNKAASAEASTLKKLSERYGRAREQRELLAMQSYYLRRYGPQAALKAAGAQRPDRKEAIERALLACGYFRGVGGRSLAWRLYQSLRGALFRALVPNGLARPASWA